MYSDLGFFGRKKGGCSDADMQPFVEAIAERDRIIEQYATENKSLQSGWQKEQAERAREKSGFQQALTHSASETRGLQRREALRDRPAVMHYGYTRKADTGLGSLGMFFTPSGAEQYIQTHLQSVYKNSVTLRDQLHAVGALIAAAKQKNPAKLPALERLREEIKASFVSQLALEQKLSPFAAHFGINTGLGALPIVLAGSAIIVAGLIYTQTQKIKTQQQTLDLLSKGLITSEQAQSLMAQSNFLPTAGEILGPLKGIGLYVLLGVGLYFGAQAMMAKKMLGR